MGVTCLPFVHRLTTILLISWLQVTALFAALPATALKSTIFNGTNNSVDRVSLLAIKSLIRDDPQGVTSSWNESYHFCQWQGVTCSPLHQRVIALHLSSSGLVGSLSPWIGNMSFLMAIRLENNSLSGEIPQQLGRLSQLQQLVINNNSFEGNIPSSLSNCSNLNALHLGINKLVGKIPYEFGSLTMLKYLLVFKNNLTGGIPTFIGNLSLLETLHLGNCHLVGSIPDPFNRLKNLKVLAFSDNELVGNIPPSLYNLSLLEVLFLDNNHLHGTLDTNLVLLQPRIQVLSVPNNQLTGPLRASVFFSTELASLDISENRFSGKIVISSRDVCAFVELFLGYNSLGSGDSDEMNFINTLSNCSKLEKLDVVSNNLKGLLPESLAKFSTKLYFLRLSSNNIWGNLPSSLGNLSGLTTLELSYNQFMGTIPASIGRLQKLGRLKLTHNNLAGDIPDTFGNLSSLTELHMGMNNLNGTIPSSLGNCKKLTVLTLEQNFLHGSIPKNLFGLVLLSISLNLGGNRLSGNLPFEIGIHLKTLNELILAENLLSGELPSSIGSLSSLQNLKIGRNFFHGSLPPSMVSLRALENLDVSFNNFTGQIPRFLEILPLESLNISFNGFEGQVSSKGVFSNASKVIIKGNSRLCGGIPELLLPKCSPNHSKGTKKLSLSVMFVLSVVPVLFCAAAISVSFFYWRKMKDRDADDTSNNIDESSHIKISYRMLYNATDGFSPNNVIGKGGFASVYRGHLDLYGGIVAVKVLNLRQKGGSKSFISECNALINARHRNLVKVITCCTGSDFEGNEFKALVYDFMPNGSLDGWLHSSHMAQNFQNDLPQLSLLQRVSIALDVAYALDYLHNRNGRTIVHCDLKPSNILLDKDMVAHVGDFGLSKILQPEHVNKYDSSIGIRGTIGYVAPEYGLGGKVSTSGDIYSYGVLLLEMLTSKRPTDPIFEEEINLHNYARTEMRDHLIDIVDPILLRNDFSDNAPSANKNEEDTLSMRNEACLRLIELGVACSMELPQHRMDIDGVIQELHLVKEVMLGTSTS